MIRRALVSAAFAAIVVSASSAAADPLVDRVYVVVVDGLEPEDVSPLLTPNLWRLVDGGEARLYENALANMITETNANHAAMMTGTFGDVSGMVANAFIDSRNGTEIDLNRPSLMLVPTLFDAIEAHSPSLVTATVLGKAKLRELFDGTGGPSSDNPEAVSVTHVRPDLHWGATETPDVAQVLSGQDLPAEPATGSGYTLDTLVVLSLIRIVEEHDPAFTFVNFPGVDGVQHLFGSKSAGRAAVVNADLSIGLFVEFLKASGRWEGAVLIVTADHSFQNTGDPVGLPDGDPGLAVHNHATPHVTGTAIALDTLLAGACPGDSFAFTSHGGSASVYLTGGFDPYTDVALDPAEQACLSSLRQAALANQNVDEALYRLEVDTDPGQTIADHHADWRLGSPRAGELILTAKDTSWFVSSTVSSDSIPVGNHGGPSARPIPFVVASGSSILTADTDATNLARPVDIAPTVSCLLDVPPPAASEGRVLGEAFAACAP